MRSIWPLAKSVAFVAVIAIGAMGCGGGEKSDTGDAGGKAGSGGNVSTGGAGGTGGSGGTGGDGGEVSTGGSGGAGGANAPPVLCDGSDRIRLAYSASGGFLSPDDQFLAPFAFSYLAVRGDCSYIVSVGPSGEIRTGELGQDRAAQLSAELGFTQIAEWSAFQDSESCPDAGAVILRTLDHRALCTCGCGPNAPVGLEEALQAAHESMQALWSSGQPLSGPVTAEAYTPPENVAWWPGELTPQDWPLSSAIDLILVDDATAVGASTGVLFEQMEEAAALRALRQSAAEQWQPIQSFPVRAGNGVVYALLVRDELPESFIDLPEFLR